MSHSISRPKADKKKIHCKNEFELCYLRHQYLRKADTNPTKDEMSPYLGIAEHFAKNTYFTYKNLFRLIGFEKEDVISISQVQLVSFLGLFSLDKLPKKYEEFSEIFWNKNSRDPDKYDCLNKNKANFTIFIKQRMEDLVRICRQKVRNIKGLPTEEFFFYYGPKKPPKILRNLLESHEEYGFKKLESAVYRSIRKKVKGSVDSGPEFEGNRKIFTFGGNYYVAVPVEQKTLCLADFCGAGMDPYDSIHNMTPEQVFCAIEESDDWEKRQEEFFSKPKTRRVSIIKRFIRNNKDNEKYREEVKAARKMLKEIGV